MVWALGLSGLLRLFGFLTDPLLSSAEIHRVVGRPDGATGSHAFPRELRTVTWNIEQGAAYESIVALLRPLDADVVLLQEVDWNCRRTGFQNIPRDLARALGMNWVAAGEFQEIGEGGRDGPAITGQAVLSRFPIVDAAALSFKAQARWRWSINPLQPRRGGRIALKARTAGMLIYNTHIESGANEVLQRRQIQEIISDTGPLETAPVIIGGDFNNGPIIRAAMFGHLLEASFTDALGAARGRRSTSLGSNHPIDWIFVKNITTLGGHVVEMHNPPPSDHFPVAAMLDMTPAFSLSR